MFNQSQTSSRDKKFFGRRTAGSTGENKDQFYNGTPVPEQEADLVLPKDPNRAVDTLIAVIDRVEDVYRRETKALKGADTSAFIDLQGEKVIAAQNYQAGINQLMERAEEIKQASPALKQKLEQRREDFNTTALENMDALERMQRSLNRLNDRIMEAARRSAKENTGQYGAAGQMRQDERRALSIGISEQV